MSGWRPRIEALLAEYAWTLDNDRLEDWAALFVEDCRYEVLSLENERRGMSLALFVADNRAMLRDRVRALRGVNKYRLHVDRHLIGPARIMEEAEDTVRLEANFCIFESDAEGHTRLFSAGVYRDCLVRAGEAARIKEKRVVVDTFCIPSMLSTPL